MTKTWRRETALASMHVETASTPRAGVFGPPRFLRFPGGCYVEGDKLANAFRWKPATGAWVRIPLAISPRSQPPMTRYPALFCSTHYAMRSPRHTTSQHHALCRVGAAAVAPRYNAVGAPVKIHVHPSIHPVSDNCPLFVPRVLPCFPASPTHPTDVHPIIRHVVVSVSLISWVPSVSA
jgi:hypothetical protein